MKLMIVESPKKVETLSGILGDDWKVAATWGHIRDLPEKDLGVDLTNYSPEYVYKPPLKGKPHTDAEQRMRRLRVIASGAEHVYIATDPDREGEAISWHVRECLGLSEGQYSRVTFGAIERPAIMKALAEARDIDMDRVHAQEGRRVLDRFVGYMVSPVLSDAAGMPLSAGRVQSVALRLIVDRERQIEKFRVTNHFGALIPFDGGTWAARWDTAPFVSDDKPYVMDQAVAKRAAACRAFTVIASESKDRKENPPAPFSTATLLQAAAVSLHFSTDRTMKAAQHLFEGSGAEHGHISYHRTDSVNFSDTSLAEIRAFIADAGLPLSAAPRKYKEDESAQEGHQAIRPTDLSVEEAGNTVDERALYRLIRERALASQMAEAQYRVTSLVLRADDAQPGDSFTYKATGKVLIDGGWRAFMKRDERDADADEDDDSADAERSRVPQLAVGTEKEADDGKLLTLKTAPPKRYTEATLVGVLKEKGIGRPSTYSNIVDTLLRRNYASLVKRLFVPTEVGMVLVDTLVTAGFGFMDVAFTRHMEDALDGIAKGNGGYRALVSDLHRQLDSELTQVKLTKAIAPRFKCPKCEGALRRIAPKDKQPFWMCSAGECKHFMDDEGGRPAERKSAPCPNCGGPMPRYKKRSAPGHVWVCQTPDCETFLDDVGGKPVALHNCSKCAKPLRRFQRKDPKTKKPVNKFGWVCTADECSEFYDDDAGKPLVIKKADCPACGKVMYRRKGDDGFWWGCSGYRDGCKTTMDDENGKPVPRRPRKAGGSAPARGGRKKPSRVVKAPRAPQQLPSSRGQKERS